VDVLIVIDGVVDGVCGSVFAFSDVWWGELLFCDVVGEFVLLV